MYVYAYISIYYIYNIILYILRQSDMAMENHPFIDVFSIKTYSTCWIILGGISHCHVGHAKPLSGTVSHCLYILYVFYPSNFLNAIFETCFENLYDINESQLFGCAFHIHVHVLHHLL